MALSHSYGNFGEIWSYSTMSTLTEKRLDELDEEFKELVKRDGLLSPYIYYNGDGDICLDGYFDVETLQKIIKLLNKIEKNEN